MYRLRQSQWDILQAELERGATGATIHDIRKKFCWTKDRVYMWCMYMNKHKTYQNMRNICLKYKRDAIDQLRAYGYDDVNLFIEKVD